MKLTRATIRMVAPKKYSILKKHSLYGEIRHIVGHAVRLLRLCPCHAPRFFMMTFLSFLNKPN